MRTEPRHCPSRGGRIFQSPSAGSPPPRYPGISPCRSSPVLPEHRWNSPTISINFSMQRLNRGGIHHPYQLSSASPEQRWNSPTISIILIQNRLNRGEIHDQTHQSSPWLILNKGGIRQPGQSSDVFPEHRWNLPTIPILISISCTELTSHINHLQFFLNGILRTGGMHHVYHAFHIFQDQSWNLQDIPGLSSFF